MKYWMRMNDKKNWQNRILHRDHPLVHRRCVGTKSQAPIYFMWWNKIRLLHNFHPIPIHPHANNSGAPSDDCIYTHRNIDRNAAATTTTTMFRIDFKATVIHTLATTATTTSNQKQAITNKSNKGIRNEAKLNGWRCARMCACIQLCDDVILATTFSIQHCFDTCTVRLAVCLLFSVVLCLWLMIALVVVVTVGLATLSYMRCNVEKKGWFALQRGDEE